jgi:toxin YoeB
MINEFPLKFWILSKRLAKILLRGKVRPEPLKYLDPNTWSRRLTQEHRIVYLVKDDEINFLQARYHY